MCIVKIVDSEAEKLAILYKLREQGLDQVLVYSLNFCSDEKWLDILKNAWVLTVEVNGQPAGITWFDNQNGKSAWCHYVTFKEFMPRAAEFGMMCIKWLEDKLDVKTLFGITPVVYRHSRDLAKQWNFKQLNIVPDGCYLAKYDRYVDGILYMRKP